MQILDIKWWIYLLVPGQEQIIRVQKGTNYKENMQRKEAYIPKMNETKDSDTGIQELRP